jgi:hypothetical protein
MPRRAARPGSEGVLVYPIWGNFGPYVWRGTGREPIWQRRVPRALSLFLSSVLKEASLVCEPEAAQEVRSERPPRSPLG